MTDLPVTHLTLYKHGVGFFERRAKVTGEEVELSFRAEEMDDILKSLTAVDLGGGQVLNIAYPTPQSREERLAGCSIRLGDERSLRDLLAGLRGRRVRLVLDQGDELAGTLLGLDELPERQPLATSLVSLLLDEADQVQAVHLGRVQGVHILDKRGSGDLRFFLQAALTQEEYRQVTIRLSPGEHDLSVWYISPAPTWRVGYRLVIGEDDSSALLLGWGIIDNRLDEDLEDISLSLVAGMPISFVYGLYKPFTPDRPRVEEEARVAPGPVEFADALETEVRELSPKAGMGAVMRAAAAPAKYEATRDLAAFSKGAIEAAAPVSTTGQALGELFQYLVGTPVTIGRGQSAMVPILSADVGYRKELLYNGSKMPTHPVATLRLQNETGLTLERGPVTVLDSGEYVGEGLLPFTGPGGEVVVSYAVELGAKVREESGSRREVHGLSIKGAYLRIEEWDVRWRDYEVNNSTHRSLMILVEHPRTSGYELLDTPQPEETTDEHVRLQVQVPARRKGTLRVQERRLVTRREELRKQSVRGLQRYLHQGLITPAVHEHVAELLSLWERIADYQERIEGLASERNAVYEAQRQIQGNMGALSTTGKEGTLRSRYVQQLADTEDRLKELARDEVELKAKVEQLKEEIAMRLEALA
jgi:hypothetical protein